MKTWIWAVIGAVAAFFVGYWIGTRGVDIVETTRIDTVFFERPTPISTSDITVSVNVPKLVFARNPVMLHADSGNVASNVASFTNQGTNQGTNQATTQVAETVTNCNGLEPLIKDYLNIDSVQMEIAVRTLEYRDSTYYARVVGPVVGNLSPRLDYFETYNTTKTTTQIIKQPRKVLSLAAIVGSDYAKNGWTPYAELGLSIDIRFATITATAGVDDVFKSPQPRIGAEMGIPIWSK